MTEKIVVVGDVHIGFDDEEAGISANVDEFKEFLNNKVPELNPDTLVINGDLLELWRSSFGALMVKHSDIIQLINGIKDSGVDVVYVPGNHDYRMIELGRELVVDPLKEWEFTEEYKFESGNEEFVCVHGHRTDSINRSRIQNNALCLTTDATGEALSGAWGFVLDRPILGWLIKRDTIIQSQSHDSLLSDPALASRPNLRALSHIKNPSRLSESESKGRFARSVALLKESYEETIIAGHTHVQEEQPEQGYYNHGDWLIDGTGYIVVEEGKVEVLNY